MAIDISGLDRRDVLAALYNASRPQGMGFLQYNAAPMDREEAGQLLERTDYFDYLKGRVMKVSLKSEAAFDEWGYDRDNGSGAAQRAIDELRKSNSPSSDGIKHQHLENVEQSAALTSNRLNEETRHSSGHITLGLADVKDVLKPKIQEAKDAARRL